MRKFFGFLAGLMSGAIVGGTAALLFAPMSGEALKEEIADRIETGRINNHVVGQKRAVEVAQGEGNVWTGGGELSQSGTHRSVVQDSEIERVVTATRYAGQIDRAEQAA